MKVATILGARPQFIKAAALSKALENEGISEVLIHTGQHYDPNMSGNFFTELGINPPQYQLNIHGGTDVQQTARMLASLEDILREEQADLVLVFGDTNSTLAGALAAKKCGFPLAHIEAGMRSYLPNQAEEINRVLSDRISDLLFTSAERYRSILTTEGIPENQIFNCGDLMYDLFQQKWEKRSLPADAHLPKQFALLSIHRQENVDSESKLSEWVQALNDLAIEIPLVCPLHPRTKQRLEQFGLHLNAQILEPSPYLEILGLIDKSSLVITDSGGLQKEAYFGKKACLTLRDASEWLELLESGANRLCNANNLLEQYRKIIKDQHIFAPLYGDGQSAQRIAKTIKKQFS